MTRKPVDAASEPWKARGREWKSPEDLGLTSHTPTGSESRTEVMNGGGGGTGRGREPMAETVAGVVTLSPESINTRTRADHCDLNSSDKR